MPGESLRDQLQATFESLSAQDQGQGAAVDTAVQPGAEAAEAQTAAAVGDAPTEAPEAGQPRDEHGRFAQKDKQAPAAEAPKDGDPQAKAPTESETAAPEDKEAPKEPIRVPPSLPAAVKAKFATLEPDVQQAFVKLEESVQTAKAEWGRKGERLNRFDEILAPRREQLAMRGLDEVQAIQVLFAAQDLLDRNPTQGLLELARSYGVNLAQLGQQMSGGQPMGEGAYAPGHAPGFDPNALQSMIAKALTPIQQQLQTFQQQTEAEKQASAQQVVAEFASRPENIYWEDVKNDVAFLLQNGRANTLEDAYEQAIWASPVTRPLLIQSKTADQQRQAREQAEAQRRQAEARTRSQAAQAAAGSVTGAPQGVQAAPAQSSTGNLRQDLEAAFQATQTV